MESSHWARSIPTDLGVAGWFVETAEQVESGANPKV